MSRGAECPDEPADGRSTPNALHGELTTPIQTDGTMACVRQTGVLKSDTWRMITAREVRKDQR